MVKIVGKGKWYLVLMLGIIAMGLMSIAVVVSQEEYATGSTTLNVTVKQYIAISVSQALQDGIRFGVVYANTNGNPALNNTSGPNGGTEYNITIDSSTSSDVNIFDAISAQLCTNCDVKHSTNITQADGDVWTTNTSITVTDYDALGNCNNLSPGSNCWIRYYLDVGSNVQSGDYQVTYCWCVNSTVGQATCGTCS